MKRIVISLFACIWALPALAQSFPSRPLKIVVPFPPGASADGAARTVAQELSQRLKQTVIVENVAGAGGITGLQSMSRAEPDGHTLAIGAVGAVVITPLIPGAPPQWDPKRDLLPVARLVDVPVIIVANPATGPKTLADLISQGKSVPAGLTYGSTGTNSFMHLTLEFLSLRAQSKLVHVAYRGSAPAVMDAVSGQIPFVAVDLTSARALVESEKVTPLAMISGKRVSILPNVPSLGELGFAGFESQPSLGLFAPPATPSTVVRIISGHMRDLLAKPEVIKQLHALSLEPSYLDDVAFTKNSSRRIEHLGASG